MNNMEINELLKKAFWQECSLVGSFDRSFRIEFPSKLSVDEFIEFADDCKEFLFQFGIATGAVIAANPEESNKIFMLQINHLLTIEEFTEKFAALDKALQLHEAASDGDIEKISMLLDASVDINSKNIAGETSMHIAARMGHDGIIEMLLEKGALINSINIEGETPLHIVAQTNHISTLQKLLTAEGVDINRQDKEGNTGLHLAGRLGNPDMLKQFFDHGADISIENNEGETAHPEDNGTEVSIKTSQREALSDFLVRLDGICEELEKLLLTEKPVNQPVVEQATGWIGGGAQRLRNIIGFFSPATRIQAANSTEAEQQAEVQPTAANLGK
ncbi:MAG: serine/threonine-protein phosphatase 6 regulatory ankyrin repeat subunit isoform [Pseudomonadota bacterium]|jgi:hypothetical protein